LLKTGNSFVVKIPGIEVRPVTHDLNPRGSKLGNLLNGRENRELHKSIAAVSEFHDLLSNDFFL
jgi:hypothetical protein